MHQVHAGAGIGGKSEQPDFSDQAVEAARYALLRRLAPTLRHHMVGNLQPIGMICEMMERRARTALPDAQNVQDNFAKINNLSRIAVKSCTGMMTWVQPEEGAAVPAADSVEECLSMLRTEFGFRGFMLAGGTADEQAQALVSRSALRSVLCVALIALTDAAPGPAAVGVKTGIDGDEVLLSLTLAPAQGSAQMPNVGAYRRLDWNDVQALASDEAVELLRTADGCVMRFGIAQPPAPKA